MLLDKWFGLEAQGMEDKITTIRNVDNSLLEFWNDAVLDSAPYIHPKDKIAEKNVQSDVCSYRDYVEAFKLNKLSEKSFHLGLLPQPYLGNLENADIIILLTNPGINVCDYHAEEHYPEYRDDKIATLRQEKREHIFLDPKWAWTPGFQWWEGKLRKVAKRVSTERFGGDYGKCLQNLSHRIASLELIPYHSCEANATKGLASSLAAKNFANSISSDQTLIVTRRVSEWGLKDAPNIIKYPSNAARSASLGCYSDGGKAILKLYGIEGGS